MLKCQKIKLATALLMATMLTSPAFSQEQDQIDNLPTAADDGRTWDSMDPNLGYPPISLVSQSNYDAFQETELDREITTNINAETISIVSLTSDAILAAADISRNHTLPGFVSSLNSLGTALFQFENSGSARAEALMRVTEINLRIIGDNNTAALIAAGASLVGSTPSTAGTSYMRGMAQDLRKAGAIAAAEYLENAAVLADAELANTRTGIMDAASLAMRYGVTPHPELSAIVSYDPESVTADVMRDLVVDIINRMAVITDDESYKDLSEKLFRNANEDGVLYIKARVVEAQAEAVALDRARFAPKNGPTSATDILK